MAITPSPWPARPPPAGGGGQAWLRSGLRAGAGGRGGRGRPDGRRLKSGGSGAVPQRGGRSARRPRGARGRPRWLRAPQEDQVVEAAGRLPQLAIALTNGGGGDAGEPRPGPPAHSDHRHRQRRLGPDWPWWSLALAGLEPSQYRGHLAGWGGEIAAGGPLVGLSGGVAAGWGNDIAAPAPPVHMRQVDRGTLPRPDEVDAPLGCQLRTAAVMSR